MEKPPQLPDPDELDELPELELELEPPDEPLPKKLPELLRELLLRLLLGRALLCWVGATTMN